MERYPTSRPRSDVALSTRVKTSAVVMVSVVLVMWVLEFIDTISLHALDGLGIIPRRLDTLWHIFTAPWLHFGWQHIASNTIPLLVLGLIIGMSGLGKLAWVSFFSVLGSGLMVWLISPTNSITAGASGVVFGYLAYLLIRGFYSRDWRQILGAVVVLVVYGGILWGVLPTSGGVSWQGHLGGLLGGLWAAWWLHGRRKARA